MSQPKKELVVGLQMDEHAAMLTWFQSSMREPVTVDRTGDHEDGRDLIEIEPAVWKAACGQGEPIEKLRDFLQNCLMEAIPSVQWNELRIMVTVPKLETLLTRRIPMALELLGVQRKNIYLQDYLASFYHYTINQKKELRNGDVALLECKDEHMIGYVMHTDWSKAPAMVTIEKAGVQAVDERARNGRNDADWDKERDRLFFEFLKKVFERRNVVTCFLVGDYFSREWAVRSFQFLCQRRHAFQGMNLFTKGACYGAMERAGILHHSDLLFVGADVIRENMGLYLRVRGKEVYYPLVTAGVNWYEAHHECEMISDGDRQISIWTKPMTGGEEVQHILRLVHFPDRPPRASRLRLNLYFTASDCCSLEIEDLGFGGFFRPSGMKWNRKIHLELEG